MQGLVFASYDEQFSVSFVTATYIYDGTEFGHPFSAGTAKGSEGTFNAESGFEHFDYLHKSATVIEHFNAANPLKFLARLDLDPYFVACPFADQSKCAWGWFDGPLDATLTVSEIRITPNIVAVPEPATYGLMLVGLAIFLGARRKQAIRTC